MVKLVKHIDGITYKSKKEEDKEFEYHNEEYYKNEFLSRRAEISKKTYNKGSIAIEDIYADEYTEQCALAAGGDVVAMDLLSYWFKHGNPVLPENIEMSMKWLFLAAAGGNKHSINKLSLFLNYAYDSVLYADYFDKLNQILIITQDNYQSLLGEVICQKLVDELNINALDLTKEKIVGIEFNQLSMQRFTSALDRSMKKVDEYFISLVKKYEV